MIIEERPWTVWQVWMEYVGGTKLVEHDITYTPPDDNGGSSRWVVSTWLSDYRIIAQPPNAFRRDFNVSPFLDGDMIQGRAGVAQDQDPFVIGYKLENVDGDIAKKALHFQKLEWMENQVVEGTLPPDRLGTVGILMTIGVHSALYTTAEVIEALRREERPGCLKPRRIT